MSLLNSIRAISLSNIPIDDRHWKPAQQQHLIRRVEKPNFVIGEKERAIVWAAVIMYEAYEVANWMMDHGLTETGVVPDDTSEWASWVTQKLELEYQADIFLNPMVKDMKTRGCIGRTQLVKLDFFLLYRRRGELGAVKERLVHSGGRFRMFVQGHK